MKTEKFVIKGIPKYIEQWLNEVAAKENMSPKQAVINAIAEWAVKKEAQHRKVDIRNLKKMEGFIKTGGPGRWSEEIDETLYG